MTQYTRARKARPGYARLAFASLLALTALAASPDVVATAIGCAASKNFSSISSPAARK